MALSGYVTSGTAGSGGQSYFRVDWSATQSIPNNKSTVSWTLKLYTGSNEWYTNAVRIDYVKINGVQVKGSETYSNKSADTFTLATGTLDIAHDSNGTKSFSIQLSGWFYDYGTRTGSQTFTLDTIPRASGITASNANFGAVSNIKIDKKSSSFTTTVSYKASGQSSFTAIKTKTTDTSIAWTIPTSLYSLLGASSKTLSITLQCITYNGSTQIGDATTTTITATAIESACKPTVSTSIAYDSATNNLTGATNKGIKNFSTATVTITATGQYNATISSKKVTLGGVAKTSDYSFTKLADSKYTYEVKDSRGFTTAGTVNLTVVNYIEPTVIIEVTPPNATDGSTAITVKGDCFNGSFGAVENVLTVQYGYKESSASSYTYETVTTTKSGNTYTGTATITLDYTKTYNFIARVKDSANTSYKSCSAITVRTQPIISWSKSAVTVNGATTLNGNSTINGNLTTTGKVTTGGMLYVGGNINGSGYIFPDGAYYAYNNKFYYCRDTGGANREIIGISDENNCEVGTTAVPLKLYSSAVITANKTINASSLQEGGVELANKYQAKGNYLTTGYYRLGSGTASSTQSVTLTDNYGCACYFIIFKAESQWWSLAVPKGFADNSVMCCKGDTEYWTWKLKYNASSKNVVVSRSSSTGLQFYLYAVI